MAPSVATHMITRRTFLQTAALAAAPTVLVRRASATAAADRITLGFIGIGVQSRGHLNHFLGKKGVEVVGVCDVVKERLDTAAKAVETKYADRVKSGDYKGVK